MLRWKIAQAAEIRWWQMYLKNKDPKTYLAWKAQYWKDLLKNIGLENIPHQAKCLDAGCSLAGIFMALENQSVLAIDPLMEAYKSELSDFIKEDWYANTSFQATTLEALQTDIKFDYIFCLNVINHVKDIKASLDKLWEVLAPGGMLILSVDAHNYKAFKYLFRCIPADILHPYQYDLQEYKNMLQIYAPQQTIKSLEYKKEFFFNYHILQISKPL